MSERNMGDRRVFGQWVCATWVGWLLGVPLIIALALIGETVGIGGLKSWLVLEWGLASD
jgi:hypothetical protein